MAFLHDAAATQHRAAERALTLPAGRLTWIATGLALALAAAVGAAQGFRFAWASPANSAMAMLILGPWVASLYASFRGMTVVAVAAGCFAQFAAFNTAVLLLQFPLASLALPLADARLVALDAMVGGDWPAHFAWMTSDGRLLSLLSTVYGLLLPQVALACLVLAAFDPQRLRLFIAANTLALGAAAVLSALVPAESAFGYFGTPGFWSDPLEQFRSVRDGSLRTLDLAHLTGIITFPSYHTILAVLVACAFAGLPRLLPWVAALQAAIVFTTRGVGGHYLADMAAGIVIALAAWAVARRIYGRGRSRGRGSREIS